MLKKISKVENLDKPLLISGWGRVKKLYPEQRIINKQITDTVFWTFSEKEKGSEHKRDVEAFKKMCFEVFENQYKFFFLNPFETKYSQIKRIISKIKEIGKGTFFYDGKHFFIYIDNVILTINIDFLNLIKISDKRITKWLENNNFKLFQNTDIFNIEQINLNNKEYLILPIAQKIEYEKEFIVGYILE